MKQVSTKKIGESGEDAACKYLESNGFDIVWRNYHTPHGEIDIIAENKTHIIFVEVKTRADDKNILKRFGRPAHAVDYNKMNSIRYSARLYALRHPLQKAPRFDVIEVYYSDDIRIKHIENAFGMR